MAGSTGAVKAKPCIRDTQTPPIANSTAAIHPPFVAMPRARFAMGFSVRIITMAPPCCSDSATDITPHRIANGFSTYQRNDSSW